MLMMRIFVLAIVLISLAGSTMVSRNNPMMKRNHIENDSIKTLDLIILAKYAQGLVVFNSYLNYLKFIKPADREILFLHIVNLTASWKLGDRDREIAMIESGLENDSNANRILKNGIEKAQLFEIMKLENLELETKTRLLLALYMIGYKKEFMKHKNDSDKFWYWDYTQLENTLKSMQLNDNDYIALQKLMSK
jgi:hypothetical protein